MKDIVRLADQRPFVQMPTIPAQATEKGDSVSSKLTYPAAPTGRTILPPLLDLGRRRLELYVQQSAFSPATKILQHYPGRQGGGDWYIRTPVHRHPSCREASSQLREEGVRDINVVHGASDAGVDHGGLDRLAGGRAVDADLRPAFGIGVWVAAVGHL